MFIENKYSRVYYNIINRAKTRNLGKEIYTEKHHIIPKSLGGANSKDNLVVLTAKEHFVCHMILPRITQGKFKRKMIYAAWRLCQAGRPDQERYVPSSRIYAILKEQRAKLLRAVSGPAHHLYGKKTGRTSADFTDEWRKNISEAAKGRVAWNKGIPRSQEVKDAVSRANKGRVAWNKGVSRRWVNNGSINKLVYPSNLAGYLADGWVQGRYRK
jgi:hypothetical protein